MLRKRLILHIFYCFILCVTVNAGVQLLVPLQRQQNLKQQNLGQQNLRQQNLKQHNLKQQWMKRRLMNGGRRTDFLNRSDELTWQNKSAKERERDKTQILWKEENWEVDAAITENK